MFYLTLDRLDWIKGDYQALMKVRSLLSAIIVYLLCPIYIIYPHCLNI